MFIDKAKKNSIPFTTILAFLGLVAPFSAGATATADGVAELTLNQAALATFKGANNKNSADADGQRYLYINEFYTDPEFLYPTEFCTAVPSNPLFLCNSTPTNNTGVALDSQPYPLPVVPATIAPYQIGNIGSTWNSDVGGDIGLAGALKVRSAFQNATLSVRWGGFALNNTGTSWFLTESIGGGSLFELVNVTTSTDRNNHLVLSADLKFGTSDWGGFLSGGTLRMTAAEKDIIIGHINLNTNTCPLESEDWEHNDTAWPVDTLRIGGIAYNKDSLLQLLDTKSKTNSYLKLGKQYITALLNISNGAKRAPVATDLTAANAALAGIDLLTANTTNAALDTLAKKLKNFNDKEYSRHCQSGSGDDDHDDDHHHDGHHDGHDGDDHHGDEHHGDDDSHGFKD